MDAVQLASRVQVVTGYVPIVGHPRSSKEYGELGESVFGPLAAAGVNIKRYMEHVDQTWLWKHVNRAKRPPSHSVHDNPQKNSLAYHCVNHQKFGWLLKAAIQDPRPETYVWIDYGVGHVPGVDCHVIWDFLQKIAPKDLAIPGCHDMDPANVIVNDFYPCWRFCGGVLVVPRDRVHKLYKAVKGTALDHIATARNVEWEVNTLARAEKEGRLPKFRWYQADHNETMFTGYDNGLNYQKLRSGDTDEQSDRR